MSYKFHKTEIPNSNGWKISTQFGKIDSNGDWVEFDDDFIPIDNLEKLHYNILIFYRDLKILPESKDVIDDGDGAYEVDKRWITTYTKEIVLYLVRPK